ncbi:MAG: M48 family metalloprotease [Pseudomonadota bacterium]|nr:M48 family metalloprotease [Pseudomonadota bacterium]
MTMQYNVLSRTAVLISVLPLAGWAAPKFLEDMKGAVPVVNEILVPKASADTDAASLLGGTIRASVVQALATAHYRSTIVVAEQRKQLIKPTDPRYRAVKDVFDDITLAAQRSSYGEAASELEWEINLIEDPSKDNALAWPGGKVVVYSGALQNARNKGGLAAILGHEVLHALAGHTLQRIEAGLQELDTDFSELVSVAKSARGGDLDPDKLPPAVVAAITAVLMMELELADSARARDQELDADYQGLQLAAAAGYDPEDGLRYWFRYLPHTDAQQKRLLDKHPGKLERYKKLVQRKDELQLVYLQAKTTADNDKSMELLPLVAVRR